MFKSLKKVVSESESAALSISNMDDEDDSDDANALSSDPQTKSKGNKSKNIISSISSNIKEKLHKKKFHRLEIEDKPSDSIEDDIENENEDDIANNPINSDEQQNIELIKENGDRSFSQLEIQEQAKLTQQINNSLNKIQKKYSNDSIIEEDDVIELAQLSSDDDGNDSASPHKQITQNKFEDTYSFYMSLKSIFCHLLTMIFVSFTQIMVCSALYIIVPLHVTITLEGEELLTGLIFLNYGFAYLAFNIFGNMCCRYYGSTFTLLLSILMSSISLLFMAIFTDYFVWLMMMFCQGISFALFIVGSNNFIIDNISIKLQTNFRRLITLFNYISMICGCIYAGNAIEYNSIIIAIGITLGLSLSGIIFLCVFNIPPKYNDNSLVNNDSQHLTMQNDNNEDRIITKASIAAWKSSYKQLSLKQRFSIFSWIINKDKMAEVDCDTPIYELDDKLNTLQVFRKNASTILSILIFSFALTFVRCVRLLILTFKGIEMNMTSKDIGMINGISFVPEMVLYILSSKLLYKCGRKYTLIPSYLLFIISLFSLPYCNDYTSMRYIAVLFGIANGFSYGLIHKVAIDIAPTEYRDKFLNIYDTLTNIAYIIAPIFIALLIQASSMETACICSAVIVILSFVWSLCVMTDPKKTGKRYEQIDFEKSYANEEVSIDGLINGKHIGQPINKHKIQLHSIDSVMEFDESVAGNDTNVETNNDKKESNDEIIKEKNKKNEINIFKQLFNNKNENNNDENDSGSEDDINEFDEDDTYVNRIANKPIGNNIKLGQNVEENQYKFEIGHFDEEEEEESILYQLSSSDED